MSSRPGDFSQRAKLVVEIATGQRDDPLKRKVEARRNGGNARTKALSAKRRSEIARKAALARWGK